MSKKYLLVVVGPTAIGKTALGIALASHFNTEIISADSRQFYKEMNIGTAVPSEEELKAAKHHFIQHIPATCDYTVGNFKRDALQKLKDLFRKNNVVVMVGGSGLYVDAVVYGLDEFPEVDPGIRESLSERLKNSGLEDLQEELKRRDPEYYSAVDLQNPHRLIRALEICIGTGKPYSSFRKDKVSKRAFEPILIGLTAPREIVYDRINQRVEQMVKGGLVKEARQLQSLKHLNALNTVGYKELFRFFEGERSLETAVDEIKKNTRRFAKRQFTWFRKNEKIQWFDYATPFEEIISFAEETVSHS